MTMENIKFYGEMFKELGLTEFKIKDNDSELVLKKEVKVVTESSPVVETQNVVRQTSNNMANVVDSKESLNISTTNGTDVKAPLVGVFYAAPSPEAEPFVKLGDTVNKGDVLCVIEAMKMFNEIKSEVSGKIAEIYVDNGNIVEYGQTLFKIEEV